MAKPILATDFKDDIMQESMNGKRRYRMVNNSDGTVSFEDVTDYQQVGNSYGAGQINTTNEAVNASADAGKIIDDIDTIRNVTKEGYVAGALALKQVDDSLIIYKTYSNTATDVPAGLNKGSATALNISINDMSANDYEIVSVTPYTSDAAVLATCVHIPIAFSGSNRISLALINQYNSKVSCTVSVIVGFKAK